MTATEPGVIVTADPIQAVRAFFERLSRNCAAVDYDATERLFADDVASFGTKARIVVGLAPLRREQWERTARLSRVILPSTKEILVTHDILDIKTVHPTKGYSHAARAGKLLFIAGQVAKDRDDKLVGPGDVAAQARQIYRNLGAVLGEAGGSLSDIVKMTTYLTHSGYVESYRTVRNEFFTDPMPPNTLVICESLAMPEFLMEVEAIAVLG